MTNRDKAIILLGQLEAIQFPIISMNGEFSHAYYDLLESIISQYKSILKDIYPDFEDE